MFLSLALVVFVGCTDSPSTVVNRFHTALKAEDTNTLEKTALPDVASSAKYSFGGRSRPDSDDYYEQRNWASHEDAWKRIQAKQIDNCSHTIDGNTATVKIVFKDGQTRSVELVKIDGQWKIKNSRWW